MTALSRFAPEGILWHHSTALTGGGRRLWLLSRRFPTEAETLFWKNVHNPGTVTENMLLWLPALCFGYSETFEGSTWGGQSLGQREVSSDVIQY